MAAGLDAAGDRAATGVGQGVGLGFLGGLPLFSLGALLGSMGQDRRDEGVGLPEVGVPSVLGAAAGVFLAGTVLIPNAAPYSLYLFCLVVLSGGALLHGWVLDARPTTVVLARTPGPTGELRVERRALGARRQEIMVLLEGEWEPGAWCVWCSWWGGGGGGGRIGLGPHPGTGRRPSLPWPGGLVRAPRASYSWEEAVGPYPGSSRNSTRAPGWKSWRGPGIWWPWPGSISGSGTDGTM